MKISECFVGIQGEGATAGRPRLFIRTSGCSLRCSFCDTKYHVKGKEIDKKDEKLMSENQDWCITGGEPLLNQKKLVEYIKKNCPYWVEVETNGTVIPNDETLAYVNQFNVSPKEKRFQPKGLNPEPVALSVLKANDTIVKFVYSDKQSEKFIRKIIKKYNIPHNIVWIMPEGTSKKKIDAKTKEVWNYCLKNKFNFSPRLHVTTFGTKKGI